MSNYLYENLEHKLTIEKTSENLYVDEHELILEGLYDIFISFKEIVTTIIIEAEVGFIDEKYSFRLYEKFLDFQYFMVLSYKMEDT